MWIDLVNYKENKSLISKERERERRINKKIRRKKANIESMGAGSWPLSNLGWHSCGLAGHRWMTALLGDN